MISLSSISRGCFSVSGIYSVCVQNACYLSDTPANELGFLANQTSAPTLFVQYKFNVNTARYNAEAKRNESGQVFVQELSLSMSVYNLTKARELVKLIAAAPLVAFKDKNGLWRIMGSKQHPCKVDIIETTGERGTANGITLDFSATQSIEAANYTGSLPAAACYRSVSYTIDA